MANPIALYSYQQSGTFVIFGRIDHHIFYPPDLFLIIVMKMTAKEVVHIMTIINIKEVVTLVRIGHDGKGVHLPVGRTIVAKDKDVGSPLCQSLLKPSSLELPQITVSRIEHDKMRTAHLEVIDGPPQLPLINVKTAVIDIVVTWNRVIGDREMARICLYQIERVLAAGLNNIPRYDYKLNPIGGPDGLHLFQIEGLGPIIVDIGKDKKAEVRAVRHRRSDKIFQTILRFKAAIHITAVKYSPHIGIVAAIKEQKKS